MMQMLQVERDTDGLHQAVRELFEESFFAEATRSILAKIGADDDDARERILFDEPVRSLSPGYYDRSAYLMGLGASIECGAQGSAATLTHDDVLGLQAVRRAKAGFERDHPSCHACGTRQHNRVMNKCHACQAKLAGRGD